MHPTDLQCQTGLFKVKTPFGWAFGRRQWESPAMPADAVRPFTLVLLSAALLSGCRENNSARQNEPPPPSVSVSEPVRKMVTEWDEFTGHFQAVDHVSIRPRVSGYLQSAHFQEGSMVKKGDLLFVIDPPAQRGGRRGGTGTAADGTVAAHVREPRSRARGRTRAHPGGIATGDRPAPPGHAGRGGCRHHGRRRAQARQARRRVYAGHVSDRRTHRTQAGDGGQSRQRRRYQRDAADHRGIARSDLPLLQSRRANLSQEFAATPGCAASHRARQSQRRARRAARRHRVPVRGTHGLDRQRARPGDRNPARARGAAQSAAAFQPRPVRTRAADGKRSIRGHAASRTRRSAPINRARSCMSSARTTWSSCAR